MPAARQAAKAPENARLLQESGYFARSERLGYLASYFAALACALALIFLSVAPGAGMRPLIVRLPGVWFRYSLIGDIVLLLASYRRARLAWGSHDSLAPCLLCCLSLAHALTSWHDPWGIFFSNALIEFLLFFFIIAFLCFWFSLAAPLPARIFVAVCALLLACLAFASIFAHIFGLLGFAARSLPARLFSALAAGQYFAIARWLVLLMSLAGIALCIYLIIARRRLDPDLARMKSRVYGE